MIPLRDNIPPRTTPIVNHAIIGVTAFVFLLQLADPDDHLVDRYGMVPHRVSHPDAPEMRPVPLPDGRIGLQPLEDSEWPTIPPWTTMLTCIFLHGGWLHFLGNMWFLYIFGDNVEDRFGHGGYLLLYLGFGVAASLSHFLNVPESMLPTVGASGAIAGVMGAYMYLYPRAQVLAIVPIFVILQLMVIPAPVFLGIWFLFQLLSSTAAGTSGVAWWAHIGGFVVGFVVAALLGRGHHLKPPVQTIRPGMDHTGRYRRIEPRYRRID